MNKQRLFSLLQEMVMSDDLQPEPKPDGTTETHCNFSVIRTASYFGCHDFDAGPNANTIHGILKASRDWSQASGSEAQVWANKGMFAIAAKRYEGHGHVAVVIPSEQMHHSGSWNKEVPWLADVGKENGIKPASKCFPVAQGEPDYFLWNGSASY